MEADIFDGPVRSQKAQLDVRPPLFDHHRRHAGILLQHLAMVVLNDLAFATLGHVVVHVLPRSGTMPRLRTDIEWVRL